MPKQITLFDTTLRDGAQTLDVDFSLADKLALISALDDFGIPFIEGGWPGANPIDTALFDAPPSLRNGSLVAFGMTRRAQRSAANDPVMAPLLQTKVSHVCLVGKSSLYQVKTVLNVPAEENLAMIGDSIAVLKNTGKQVFFDAEHFFDGYKDNPEYTLSCISTAFTAGACEIVLCDTKGGTMPADVAAIVCAVHSQHPQISLGIHAHNDTGQAVAISHAAIDAGCRHVQGTLNGLGERCGNANIQTLVANLILKTDYDVGIPKENLKKLRDLSLLLDDRLGQTHKPQLPYVGGSAFAHKAGLHGAAVAKNPHTYEHIEPSLVGNSRQVIMSDQGGRANLVAKLENFGLDATSFTPSKVKHLLALVKQREFEGMSYQGADASLELLLNIELNRFTPPFFVDRFRVIDEKRRNALGKYTTESEATVIITIGDRHEHMVAFGEGPINALDIALRTTLLRVYPALKSTRLADYKVRVLPIKSSDIGTDAVTRVSIEFNDGEETWSCAAISDNIISASMNALLDAYYYKLFCKEKSKSP